VEEWREAWRTAAAQPSAEQIRKLTSDLEQLGLSDEDGEIEREMLEALERVVALESSVAEQGLPSLETGHRIAGAGPCHFSAPASMPDDETQPSGRLLLTSVRAAFAAGGASRTLAWHTITDVAQQDRDVILIRSNGQTGHRFRFNSYGDAVCAAFIARHLAGNRRARGPRV
jgi:hypothetical protein